MTAAAGFAASAVILNRLRQVAPTAAAAASPVLDTVLPLSYDPCPHRSRLAESHSVRRSRDRSDFRQQAYRRAAPWAVSAARCLET